jgi:hypothetical protein
MHRGRWPWQALLGCGLVAVWMAGCTPGPGGPLEEQKEPYYRLGKARVNGMDYTGAVEAFQRALEVNPRSASAHFELGWLYDVKVPDPAAAVYHYERYLQLRPRAENADIVRQRILACKQELARSVLPLPISPGLQREFEQLAEENRRLKADLARWQSYAADLARALSNATASTVTPATGPSSPPPDTRGGEPRVTQMPTTAPQGTGSATPSTQANPRPDAGWRVHVVQPGETPTRIARRYGVGVQALLDANPGLDPRRMRVGQQIRVPPP